MWNQWTEQAKKGFSEFAEKTGEALEKTGDVITKAASNPHARHKPRPPDPNLPRNLETLPAEEVEAMKSPKNSSSASSSNSPQDIRAKAAAVLAGVQAREESVAKSAQNKLQSPAFANFQKNFSTGWSNVVENAKKGVQTAQDLVEKEQQRLELILQNRDVPKYFSRDLSLPLDVSALKDAEVVYVTDRIISMSHPALPSNSDPNITGERKLAAVAHLLEKRHGSGNVMVWNLSEVTNYHQQAAGVLERVGPVLAFSFPGSPAPPLGLWLQLLLSLEKWLQASPDNVAVVHCLTGKGRTSTVLAAFLCWMAEAGFEKTNMTSALQYIAQCKKMPVDELTIPSQRRYAQYFTNMLEGVRPSQPPLVLKRIIMSEAPHFALGPPLKNSKDDNTKDGSSSKDNKDDTGADKSSNANSNNENDKKDRMGCAPYLQVFQAGQLLHTVAATLHFQQQPEALPFCQVADGSIAFHVDQVIQGDVLIRCRHLAHSTKQKISMFRAAFHTGYVPPNVLRFTKAQLDGACHDPRFPEDFFVDLIIEPCSAEQASNFYAQQEAEIKEKEKAAAEAEGKTFKDEVVSASTYDSMLHRDSRFWDVISEHLKTQDGKKDDEGAEPKEEEDPAKSRMGKTVGKRRVFTSTPKNSKGGDNSSEDNNAKTPAAQEPLQTFSIGGELDFLPEPEKKTTPTSSGRPKQQPKSPKKDSLMEALMGALGDEHGVPDTEEIVFDDGPAPAPAAPASVEPSPTIVSLPPAPAPAPEASAAADSNKTETASTSVQETAVESDETKKKNPPPEHQETTESMKEMEDLLHTEDTDDDVDVDALLGDEDGDEDFNLDDYNADEEDAELEDLENFLSQAK